MRLNQWCTEITTKTWNRLGSLSNKLCKFIVRKQPLFTFRQPPQRHLVANRNNFKEGSSGCRNVNSLVNEGCNLMTFYTLLVIISAYGFVQNCCLLSTLQLCETNEQYYYVLWCFPLVHFCPVNILLLGYINHSADESSVITHCGVLQIQDHVWLSLAEKLCAPQV